MRQFNTRLFAILLGSTATFGVGLFAVHWLQTGRIAQGLLYQAKRAEEQGQPEQAARYLSRYLEFNPTDVGERGNLARTLAAGVLEPGKTPSWRARERATFVLEQVVAQDPSRADLRRTLVKVAMIDRKTEQALGHLKALPEDPETLDLTGQCHDLNGRAAEAATAYWKAIQAEPTRRETYGRLAALMRKPNAVNLPIPVKTAEEVFDLLVEKNSDSFQARVARWRSRPASVEKDAKELDAASRDVLEAVKLAPDEVEVLLAAGELALAQAQLAAEKARSGDKDAEAERDAAFDRARESLNKAIKLYPKDRRVYMSLAQVETTARKGDAALAALETGLKALPNMPDLLWAQANLLLDDGKDEAKLARARAVLDQMKQTKGSQVGADYLQARLALLAGRWREAGQKLESVRIALDKDSPSAALLNQVDLYLAQCYEQTDEPGLRREALDRLVKRAESSDSGSSWLALSRRDLVSSLMAQGRFDEAVLQLKKVADSPDAPKTAWLDLARVLTLRNVARKLNDWKEVDEALKKAVEASPGSIEPYMLDVRVLIIRNKIDAADQRLGELQDPERFEKSAEPWVAQAALANMRGDAARALQILDNAEKVLGDDVDLKLARIRFWSQQPKDQARAELKKFAAATASLTNDDEKARILRGLVEAHYRVGQVAEARKLWSEFAGLPRYQNDLRVKQVQFDLAVEARDWAAVDAAVKDIQRVEGPDGPMGNYALALRMLRKADDDQKAPPPEARELLDRVAAARPKWSTVQLARAELEVKAKNFDQAVLRLREAVGSGDTRNARAAQQLVSLLRQLGRIEEANAEIRKLPQQAVADADLQWLSVDLAMRDQNPTLAVQRAMTAMPRESKNYLDYLRLGLVLAADGRKLEAEQNLREATRLAPTEAEAWVTLCQFLAANQRQDEAEKQCVPQVEKEVAAEARPVALARCYEALGKRDKAQAYFDEALKARPDHAATLRMVVNFYIRGGELARAEPLLRMVAEGQEKVKASADDRLWARRGLALVQSANADFRRFGEALTFVGLRYDAREGRIADLDAASAVTVEDRRVQAQVLATQPQRVFRTRAIECLLDIEKQGALTLDDRFLMARLYEIDGSMTKAREQWLALVKAQTANPLYVNQYAQHLLRNKSFSEAQIMISRLEDMEKARKAEFGSVELRAQMFELRGEGDKAADLLRAHFKREGARPEEVFLLVSVLARQKKVDEALTHLEASWGKCVPELVSGASVSVLRAAGLPTQEQVARVEKRLREVSQQNPDKTLYLLHLADLYDLRGDYRQAVATYRQVLDKEARNYVAMNNMAWLLAQTSGDTQEALKLIGQAIEGLGERPELLDTRATVLLSQKQARLAISDLERANADARSEARSVRLAQAYLLANDRPSAVKAFQEAQQAGFKPEKLHPIEQKTYQQLQAELAPR